ncbi:Bug family tripartite tricarboxylate transporter substrate binding protein [Diaphorobacter caeni]|uniref:Bug family tripartite tricarboxylate transporter substrate binding protein n=1 Tax=Diaphorobacter caeni TaxID=2784387 RepID=UPI0018906D3D|nr:tripartite tricarboxylate transporter substrate binding protein [Diaphorobacter caeni]MBF5007731.1 tripartite tricarboxylate transporter substrate binding protein [Diaphorobacter caeni]
MNPSSPPSTKRRWIKAAAHLTLAAAAVLTLPAHAQTYPNKPVRMIVPYGPGTAPDVLGRITADALQRRLGQAIVVENRAGAGGKIGTEAAAQAAADGYTLFLGTKDSQSIIPNLYPTWNVKPHQALTPVASLARIENVLVSHNGSAIKAYGDMVSQSSKRELSYGSPGIGTNLHLMVELIKARQGLQLMHVPYSKSFSEAIPALMRNDLDLVVAGLPPMLPFVKDGRLKAIAITGTSRSRYAPDVPTFAELGIQDLETGGWFGVFVPTGTPAAAATRLNQELAAIVKSDEFRTRLETLAAEPWAASPADLNQIIEKERTRWGKLIQSSNIVLN